MSQVSSSPGPSWASDSSLGPFCGLKQGGCGQCWPAWDPPVDSCCSGAANKASLDSSCSRENRRTQLLPLWLRPRPGILWLLRVRPMCCVKCRRFLTASKMCPSLTSETGYRSVTPHLTCGNFRTPRLLLEHSRLRRPRAVVLNLPTAFNTVPHVVMPKHEIVFIAFS